MAREEESSPVSLFSFQDIITSLTGIMFLVVLMLLLVVLSPHGLLVPEVDPETGKLQKEVQTLREKLEKLVNANDEIAKKMEELGTLSDAELADRMDAAQAKMKQLQKETDADSKRLRTLAAQLEELKKEQQEVKAATERVTANVPPLEKEIEKLKQNVKDTEARQRRNAKVVNFTVPRPSGKKPQLLELSKDGVQLLVPDGGRREDFRVTGNAVNSLEKFQSYLNAHKGEAIYFSVVVRPDGFPEAQWLLDMLQKSGFERGIEFLPSNDATIFSEETP